jgi:uncharacterized protein with HEPN domain
MSRDAQYLLDIFESARNALAYVSGKSFEDFEKDIQCQDAVARRLEIIGEAANRVSSAQQEKLSDLPWHAMIGMRNFMIHQYDAIDFKIVWDTVQKGLPAIISRLDQLVS